MRSGKEQEQETLCPIQSHLGSRTPWLLNKSAPERTKPEVNVPVCECFSEAEHPTRLLIECRKLLQPIGSCALIFEWFGELNGLSSRTKVPLYRIEIYIR